MAAYEHGRKERIVIVELSEIGESFRCPQQCAYGEALKALGDGARVLGVFARNCPAARSFKALVKLAQVLHRALGKPNDFERRRNREEVLQPF